MLQDVPPDFWDKLPETGGSMTAVAVAAFFAVKGAFNGVRSDVQAIKEAVEKIAEKQAEHERNIAVYHERHETLRDRIDRLEEHS